MILFSSRFLCIVVLLVLFCPVQSGENEVTTINEELSEDKIKGVQHGDDSSLNSLKTRQNKLHSFVIGLRSIFQRDNRSEKTPYQKYIVRGYESGIKSHPYLAYFGIQDGGNSILTSLKTRKNKLHSFVSGFQSIFKKANRSEKNLYQKYIVRGYESGIMSHPYLAYFGLKNGCQFCGGSIISSEFILTAAHCLANRTSGKLYPLEDRALFLGVHDRFSWKNAKSFGILYAIVHENYLKEDEFNGFSHHDIGLIKVYPQIVYNTFIQPICLTENDINVINSSTMGIIQGWGRDFSVNGSIPRYTMETTLTIISGDECSNYMSNLADHHTVVCGYDNIQTPVSGPCFGDSGGPFVTKTAEGPTVQIGIVSWGEDCALDQHPTIFTRVSHFLPWIFSHVPRSTVCDGYLIS